MGVEKVFKKAAVALNSGGKRALLNPPDFACSAETHRPFCLMEHPSQFSTIADELFLWGNVSTRDFQFHGDRTDVNDTFSLVWAMQMRAFGLSSPWLIDDPHGNGCDGELSGRHLVMQQCPVRICEENFSHTRSSLNAWTAFAFHLLEGVFDWESINQVDLLNIPVEARPDTPEWIISLMSYLKHPKDANINYRRYPCWVYFSSLRKGVTVVRLNKDRVRLLKAVLASYHPTEIKGEHALCVFANGIPNAIPHSVLSRSRKILNRIDDPCNDPLIMPIDSHCIILGDNTLLALKEDCGREIFDRERELLSERRKVENRVFFFDTVIRWILPLIPRDFENLCLDVLKREPGVMWAKPVGTTYDRDGGRDILIERLVPRPHKNSKDTGRESSKGEAESYIGMDNIRTIVQVKSRKKAVGKSEVMDIRDTIEHHQVDGYLLIVHPRITADLHNHLEALRNRTRTSVDWWEDHDLEDRLRCHPDIIGRYPNLLESCDPKFSK